jgi:chorismate mutase
MYVNRISKPGKQEPLDDNLLKCLTRRRRRRESIGEFKMRYKENLEYNMTNKSNSKYTQHLLDIL